LRGLDYQIDVEIGDVAADREAFLDRVRSSLRARVKAFTHLLACEPWDLAIAVLTETDRLQHFLWDHVADPDSSLHEAVLGVYREIDDAVGAFAGQADNDTDLFIVSDHGFGPADCQFNVNAWLRSQGWLADLAQAPALAAVDQHTRVFALDPGRFYLHAKDRFPKGALTPAEAADLASELATKLRRLCWRDGEIGEHVTGAPMMSAVYQREEIYDGPWAKDAPDIVAVPASGVQLRGGWKAQAVTGPDILTGTHTRDNAVFWTSRSELTADRVDMADVAPTVLASLGIDANIGTMTMDGQNLLAAGGRRDQDRQHTGG
jgi:predicted AlkP superfamily phosphohydrolase/phosphomutase